VSSVKSIRVVMNRSFRFGDLVNVAIDIRSPTVGGITRISASPMVESTTNTAETTFPATGLLKISHPSVK
jgi:hypothetical protein